MILIAFMLLSFMDGPEIEARLEPERTVVGSEVRLIVEVIGEAAADCDVARVPEIPGVKVDRVEGPRFLVQPVQGGTVLVARFAVVLIPMRAGSIDIPPIQIAVQRGDEYLSRALVLTVGEGTVQSALKVETDRDAVFLHERFSIRITIDAADLPEGEILDLPWLGDEPSFIDLKIEPPPNDAAVRKVKLSKGEMRLPFSVGKGSYRCTLSYLPVKTGTFTLSESTLLIPGKKLISSPTTLKVIPLPAMGRPGSFTNGVGDLAVRFEAHPLEVKVGESLELTLFVEGGNAAYLEWPEFASLDKAFKRFGVEDGIGWRNYHIAPRTVEVKEIPQLAFSWFDPGKKRFETVTFGPEPISVLPGSARAIGIEGAEGMAAIITDWPSRDGTTVKIALSGVALLASGIVFLWVSLNRKRREAALKWKENDEARKALSLFMEKARGADPDTFANAFRDFVAARFGRSLDEAVPRGVREDLDRFMERLDALRFRKEMSGAMPGELMREGTELAKRLDGEVNP